MSGQPGQAGVVVLVDDLIFQTRIRSTAASVGASVAFVKSVEQLAEALDRDRPRLVIVDLNTAGVEPGAVVRAVRERASDARVIGYVSHVDTDLKAAADAARVDEVMPRSKFTKLLPELLVALGDG